MAKWPWDQHDAESDADYRSFCAWRDGNRVAGPPFRALLWPERAKAYDMWRGPLGPQTELAEEVRQTALRITLAHLRESERTGILEIPLAQAAKLALAAGAQKDRREYALSESELRRIYAPQTLEAPPGLATMNDEELWQLRTLQDKAQGR